MFSIFSFSLGGTCAGSASAGASSSAAPSDSSASGSTPASVASTPVSTPAASSRAGSGSTSSSPGASYVHVFCETSLLIHLSGHRGHLLPPHPLPLPLLRVRRMLPCPQAFPMVQLVSSGLSLPPYLPEPYRVPKTALSNTGSVSDPVLDQYDSGHSYAFWTSLLTPRVLNVVLLYRLSSLLFLLSR